MSYELSFSPEFFHGEFGEEGVEVTDKPRSVLEALYSLEISTVKLIMKDVLGIDWQENYLPEDIFRLLLLQIRKVNTCSNLSTPVEVWIDELGDYTIEVY